MGIKEQFIDYFNELAATSAKPMPEGAKEFYDFLVSGDLNTKEKTPFTENGKIVLTYLQGLGTIKTLKSREIAEALGISSRIVSGSMRKLVLDGYVEKFGQNPVVYALTKKGKEINLNEEKQVNEENND